MKLEFSVRAEEDLIEIYIYGASKFGVTQAERYYLGLQNAFDLICRHPAMARERREFNPPVRVHFHDSHVIAYIANPENVFIVRVVDARQDWARILRDH